MSDPLITTERISEIAKGVLKWTPHPPHYTPALYEVMDAIHLAVTEASAEMEKRKNTVHHS